MTAICIFVQTSSAEENSKVWMPTCMCSVLMGNRRARWALLSVVWTLPCWTQDNHVSTKVSLTHVLLSNSFSGTLPIFTSLFALESLPVFNVFFSFFALRERMNLSSFPSAVLLCRGFTQCLFLQPVVLCSSFFTCSTTEAAGQLSVFQELRPSQQVLLYSTNKGRSQNWNSFKCPNIL